MINAGCGIGTERKITPLEILVNVLQEIKDMSTEIRSVSNDLSDNLFGQLPKPCPLSEDKDFVCSGSVGNFISLANNSLETLRDSLVVLKELRLKTTIDYPVSKASTPCVDEGKDFGYVKKTNRG